ncbi:MAG: hypothetical protein QOH61_752 [Chloroflexota bacterium]|nr:hypothetical protein [Chloroflexota bacterium]
MEVRADVRRVRRVVLAISSLLVLLAASPAGAADPTTVEIASAGPLTRIVVSSELNCQVAHQRDQLFEFFNPTSLLGSCGTLLAVDGTLFGPSQMEAADDASPRTSWTPVSQSAVAGAGTDASPFTIVTAVEAAGTGLRVEETDTYVVGRESYRTDIRIVNASNAARSGILYRAGDCYVQDTDEGFGRLDGASPACLSSSTADARIQQWLPVTPGSRAVEGPFSAVWARIGLQQPFDDTCLCAEAPDNGAGLSWNVTVPAGASTTVSHLTLFSPEGRLPLTTEFTADTPLADPGTRQGFTIRIRNANAQEVALDSIFAEMPGATYSPGSTRGATSGEATLSDGRLTWPGPFRVPASDALLLQFGATLPADRVTFRAGATSPSDTIAPADLAVTGQPPVGGIPPDEQGPATPLRSSVPDPTQISLDPAILIQSAAIAVAAIALIPFPAALFNGTLEAHYPEVMGPLIRLRAAFGRLTAPLAGLTAGARRPRRAPPGSAAGASAAATTDGGPAEPLPSRTTGNPFWASAGGIVLFLLLSGLLYGFLDPGFGPDVRSLTTFTGIVGGLVAVLLAFAIPYQRALRARGVSIVPRALPGTLLVGVGCVLLSRIANFQPGYLYGLIVGFVFSRELAKAEEGRAIAVATGIGLLASLVAWLGLAAVRLQEPAIGDPPFTLAVWETVLATVVTAGLEAAVFGLMPVRFLPGEKVFAWNRAVWALLVGLGTFGFCHVLLNPRSGYLADTTAASLATVVGLLVFFGLGSVLFWAWFRYRDRPRGRPPTTPDSAPVTAPPVPPPAG